MSDLTIPDIRARLYELAEAHSLPELRHLADATKRQYHGRRAPARRAAPTPAQADAIREYARTHPTESLDSIGRRFGQNQGRVSEVLFGKRGERETQP